MKCIILAGGAGNRLWPLSRKNCPKQFLNIHGEKSIFQETITRNLPFCDEFLIIAGESFRSVIDGQLAHFQGLNYRLFLEERGRGTAPAIALLSQVVSEDEMLLVLPSDLVVSIEGYSDAVFAAKREAENGQIALFGVTPEFAGETYGYIRHQGEQVTRYIEKPSRKLAEQLFAQDDVLWNSGMFLCQAGTLAGEMRRYAGHLMAQIEDVLANLEPLGAHTLRVAAGRASEIGHSNIEKVLFEQSDRLSVHKLGCRWSDISDFDTYLNLTEGNISGNHIVEHSRNVDVINTDDNQLVVVNGLSDAIVVNTPDAVYVTDRSSANDIKGIIRRRHDEYPAFFDEPSLVYRAWGTRELIHHEPGYRVRRVRVYSGRSLTRHTHAGRNENYTVVSGTLSVELQSEIRRLAQGETINIPAGQIHRLYNEADEDAILIEVDTGREIVEEDMIYYDASGQRMEPHGNGPAPEGFASAGRIDAEPDGVEIGGKHYPAVPALPDLFRLTPAFKDYLWGGTRLTEQFHKPSPYEKTAESWELSAHPAGPSTIDGGVLDGVSFADFTNAYDGSVCGWKSQTFGQFPILIKFIDAAEPLSIQIHPGDDYAFVHEKEFGKNEVWYVMDAKPGSVMYCGLKREMTREQLAAMIENHTITDALNRVEVKRGDVLFVPAGTIHAIGAGIMVCEIQQSSNSTYRVYDYDRVGKDGKKRQLHIAKAMDVVNTTAYMPSLAGEEPPAEGEHSTRQVLTRCKYFESVKYEVHDREDIYVDAASFRSILVLSGNCRISCRDQVMDAKPGDSFFVRAGRKVCHITGQCEIIVTKV